MRMASSLKTKLLALLGALVLIVLIGVNTDLVDQVRDREKDGKPVYTKHRITLNSGELTKQGSIKSDLLPVFSQEESESELEEVIQALSGSDQQERELEVRLISQDLIDDRKLNELLEFAGEVRYTGFEYQGKKFFQRSGEQQSEVEQNLEPQLAGIRELLDTSTVIADDWSLFSQLSLQLSALFEHLKQRGALYTLSDAGIIQELPSEIDFQQALTQSFPAVALVSQEFYATVQLGSDLSGIRELIQSSFVELSGREGSELTFSLRREFIPEVDSRDFFVSVGWNQAGRFKLVRLVPVYFSETAVEDCGNGQDDDQDQLVDCEDPNCAEDTRCMHGDPELDCFNAYDDDGNGFTDCDDPAYCQSLPECQQQTPVPTPTNEPTPVPTPVHPSNETSCDDWQDNDSDGYTDCSDSDCSGSWNCYWNLPLDYSTGGPTCPDGYDAGGWCYYPCNNCNYYRTPPPAPSIYAPYYGQSITECSGMLNINGYAEGADYVEIYINGSSYTTAPAYGSWNTSIYLSEGSHSISAVSYSYSNGSSERSPEQSFSFYSYCQPLLTGAEFRGLYDPANLQLSCESSQVTIPVLVTEYLDRLVLSVNGSEVDYKYYVYPGEYEFQVALPADMTSYLDLRSEAYGQSVNRYLSAYVASASDCNQAEICDNGQDDDRDGPIDCDDTDCKYKLNCRVLSERDLGSTLSSLDPEFLINFGQSIRLTGVGSASLTDSLGELSQLSTGENISITEDGFLLLRFFGEGDHFYQMLAPNSSYRLVLDSLVQDGSGQTLNVILEGVGFNTPAESSSPDRVLRHKFSVSADPVHRCGDGYISGDEQCDDGNNSDGDGCSAGCSIEVPPTLVPTVQPTINPTIAPTVNPTINPTIAPTVNPTIAPTVNPSDTPTESPTTTEDPCAKLYTDYGNNNLAKEKYEEAAQDAEEALQELVQDILKILSQPVTSEAEAISQEKEVADLNNLYSRVSAHKDHMSDLAKSYKQQQEEADAAIDECEKAKREAKAAASN